MNIPAFLLPWLAILPTAYACLAGLIVTLAHWRNYPGPAALAFAAVSLLIIAAVGQPLADTAIIKMRGADRFENFRAIIMLVSLVFNVLRAAALGLLLTAVFVGRRPVALASAPDASRLPTPTRIL